MLQIMMLWIYIIVSVFLNGFGQLMLKRGIEDFLTQGVGSSVWIVSLFKMIATPLVLTGLVAYGISMLIWLQILTRAEVSYAYPIVISLTFAIVLIGSAIFLGEKVSVIRIAGVGIILAGIFIVATS